MTKTQSAEVNSYLAIQTLFAAEAEQVDSVAALNEAADELAEHITQIKTQIQVQSSSSGAAEVKAAAFTALGDALFEIAGGLLAFADATSNVPLAAQVDFSRSGVVAGSGNAVVARAQNILVTATEHTGSLGKYGVPPAKVNAAKQLLKSYDALRGSPRQARAASASATRQLETTLAIVERLLTNRVDKLVWQFRASASDFYEKYQVARTVVFPSTHSSSAGVTVQVLTEAEAQTHTQTPPNSQPLAA
jgi:hypothetical protein